MSSTGTTISSSSCFVRPASTISTSRSPPTKRATSSSGRCVAESAIRCTSRSQSASSRSRVSARCEPRFVAATACTSSTITASTRAQDLARVRRRQDQEQALRRRDQDVGRPAQHRLPLDRRRVAGADGDGDLGPRQAEPVGRGADAGERPAQVALDVVVQGLQRGDVEQPHAALGSRRRREPVEPDEERRERLAGARRRAQEHVAAARDRRPALRLRRGRPARKRIREPRRGGRGEELVDGRRHGGSIAARGARIPAR